MSFFIRKATSKGPIRVNLAKGGLGVSVGLKGARLSTGPSGTHVFAGRKGMYYRKRVVGTSSEKGQSVKPRQTASQESGCFVLLLLVVAAYSIYLFVKAFASPIFAYGFISLVVIAIGFLIWKKLQERKVTKSLKTFLEDYTSNMSIAVPINTQVEWESINRKLPSSGRGKKAVKSILTEYYEKAFNTVANTDASASEHQNRLEVLESLLDLGDKFYLEYKKNLLADYYLSAIEDSFISEDEEQVIERIIQDFRIPRDSIQKELATIADIKKAQDLSKPLPEIENSSSVRLTRNEVLYHQSRAKLLTRRKAKQSSSLYEYSVKRNGVFLITSKRLMIIDQGISTVKLTDLVSIEVDIDSGRILLSKQNSGRPVIIAHTSPVFVGRMLSLLSGA